MEELLSVFFLKGCNKHKMRTKEIIVVRKWDIFVSTIWIISRRGQIIVPPFYRNLPLTFSHTILLRGGGYRIICESIDDNFEKELRKFLSLMKCTVNQVKIESGESVDVRKILISFDVYKKCINWFLEVMEIIPCFFAVLKSWL